MVGIKDTYGRSFKTLRVSLINTCNLGCVYCTFGSEETRENHQTSKEKALNITQLVKSITQLHEVLNLETIRFTGGEPLLYKDLPKLVKSIKLAGINNLKITTNGLLLEDLAKPLKDAGITELNVSLDAIDEDVFYKVSRRSGLDRILKGIDAALAAGIKVKLNSVIMRGLNDSQVLPLLYYAFKKGITIRFLEIMAMGHLFGDTESKFFSQEEILSLINKQYNFNKAPRSNSSTANYWTTDDGNTFGIVANETEPFCSDCNRLRLDSYGNIYGCLSSNHPISIKNLNNAELVSSLKLALEQKQMLKFRGSELSMMHIGG
ncbi:MAG TPA: radical SAM protein [Pedobacter sp.]|jgi:cyclic pyranopterin phosphate synthase